MAAPDNQDLLDPWIPASGSEARHLNHLLARVVLLLVGPPLILFKPDARKNER